MFKKIKKIWKDPVGSKIIANLIWIVILALGATIYLFYQKINLSISFAQSFEKLLFKLDEKSIITNWHYLFAFIIAIILLINRRLILRALVFIIKASVGTREYHHKNEYHFTNQAKRSSDVISSERSLNKFYIKPQDGTKEWSLKILFGHSYSGLESEDHVTEIASIYKKYSVNKLALKSLNKIHVDGIEINNLLDNYIDQEIELQFDLSNEQGGIILKVKRHDKELFKSKVKYGCSHFKIVAEDSEYDFDLKIQHERFE